MDPLPLAPGQILEGPFWDEPLRRLPSGLSGGMACALATPTTPPSNLILAPVRAFSSTTDRTFTGDAGSFFLAREAHRIRLAHPFDLLPHQVEAGRMQVAVEEEYWPYRVEDARGCPGAYDTSCTV